MFTLSHISVLECVIELVACLAAVKVRSLKRLILKFTGVDFIQRKTIK